MNELEPNRSSAASSFPVPPQRRQAQLIRAVPGSPRVVDEPEPASDQAPNTD